MSAISDRYLYLIIALLSVLLVGGIVLASRPASSTPVDCIPSTQIANLRSIVLQAKDAWVKGDAVAFANLFTEDGEMIVPGQRWQGREKIQSESDRFLQNFTVAIEIRTILIDGTQAAVEWDWSETPKATGQKTGQAQDAILIDFEIGGIRRWREYIDTKTQ
jgi:uncharacterized protein (TIGR02246 family)